MEPLPRSSESFKRMEYFLQMTLGAPAVRVERATPLIPTAAMSCFEEKWKGTAMIDGWVRPRQVSQELISMAEKVGLEQPDTTQATPSPLGPHGMRIRTGAVWLLDSDVNRRSHEVVLVRAAIGRSYIIEETAYARAVEKHKKNEDSTPAVCLRVPDGYDSLYLHGAGDEDAQSGMEPGLGDRVSLLKSLNASRRYQHEFVVQDPDQLAPVMHVVFSIDEGETSRRRKPPSCEVCIRAFATVYCRADDAKLCDKCDREVHSGNPLVAKHVRTPLNQPRVFGTCPEHPGQKLEFICETCDRPICVHCKMVGDHSSGEFGQHRLLSLESRYSRAVEASKEPSEDIDAYRQRIGARLERVAEHITAVEENSAAVEEELYRIISEAIGALKGMTQRKLAGLRGDELALRREITRVEWIEGYLDYQRAVLGPIAFLHAWQNHLHVRAFMGQDSVAPRESGTGEAASDMDVSGQLVLHSEQSHDSHVVTPGGQTMHVGQDIAEVQSRTAAHIRSQARALTLQMAGKENSSDRSPGPHKLAAVLRAVRADTDRSPLAMGSESDEE